MDGNGRTPTCGRCGVASWDVEEEYDGHGIYLGRWCPPCRTEALKGFRADIFEAYDADEPIDDPDDWGGSDTNPFWPED